MAATIKEKDKLFLSPEMGLNLSSLCQEAGPIYVSELSGLRILNAASVISY